MDAIRIESLTKSFGNLNAVDNLTLTVAEGEIFGLVGPDGAGKTTTMRLLASIMEPTSGDAWIAGQHIVKDAEALHKILVRLALYQEDWQVDYRKDCEEYVV